MVPLGDWVTPELVISPLIWLLSFNKEYEDHEVAPQAPIMRWGGEVAGMGEGRKWDKRSSGEGRDVIVWKSAGQLW